jgi:hypothetical protein
MDDLQRTIYLLKFQLTFRSKKGTEFQDWFAELAGYFFGPDFEKVRPYGAQGDLKCDGRRVSTQTIFQCYAPRAMTDRKLIAKIDEDFHGARTRWGAAMAQWIFVHNDNDGLPPKVIQHIDALRAAYPVKIEIWSESELLMLTMALDLSALEALFGVVPSMRVVDRLVLSDIVPVIEALARHEPNPNPSLTPPSAEKLEKNDLSRESALLLQTGRLKSGLVNIYFRKSARPDLGDRIAEAFRSRYAELKSFGLPADSIFKHLQDYAGGMDSEPKRLVAVLAVLSYFFETCDIFDDPIPTVEAS